MIRATARSPGRVSFSELPGALPTTALKHRLTSTNHRTTNKALNNRYSGTLSARLSIHIRTTITKRI
jgi:hypothetical protein